MRSGGAWMSQRGHGLRACRGRRRRAGVRVAVGEQVSVRVQLGAVAEGEQLRLAQVARHAPGEQRGEPAEERPDEQRAAERARYQQRRKREEDTKARLPAVLLGTAIDLNIDRVAACRAGEAGEGAAGEREKRDDVRVVAD